MDTPLDSAVQLEIRTLISNSLEEQDSALVPCFYAITGSYLYGTVTPSSDIDVRGFHCAPGKQYLLFEQPASQYSVSMELEEVDSEIDLTSYELREFGQMIAKSDFTTVELLYSDRFLINEVPAEIDGLEATIEEFLPAQLPYRYEGMVKSLHPEEAHIDTNSTTPLDLKPYIYSLRGALAAQYVVQNNTVEPKLTTLAAALLDRNEVAIVQEFIQNLQNDALSANSTELLTEIHDITERELENIPAVSMSDDSREKYRDQLATWMLEVRESTETR